MVCGLEVIKGIISRRAWQHQGSRQVGVEQLKAAKEQSSSTEIPYNVNRALLVERVAELVNEKTPGFTDITAISR